MNKKGITEAFFKLTPKTRRTAIIVAGVVIATVAVAAMLTGNFDSLIGK